MNEIKLFFSTLKSDYKSSTIPTKKEKRNCYYGIIGNMFRSLYSSISAPFIYPIWYMFREQITTEIYKDTSIREIQNLMEQNKTNLIKSKLKSNSKFLYWLWTYGDIDDPLGRGGMLLTYCNGDNTFWTRFKWSALRNPRFNINYMEFRTSLITDVVTIIDKRNFGIRYYSQGLGAWNYDGIYFKWMKDDKQKWYFIYENNNMNNLFYLGYTGLLLQDIGNPGGGRFETAYRKSTLII